MAIAKIISLFCGLLMKIDKCEKNKILLIPMTYILMLTNFQLSCFWLDVTQTIIIKLPRRSDWNWDFSAKKPNSVSIPCEIEFREKASVSFCQLVMCLDSTLKIRMIWHLSRYCKLSVCIRAIYHVLDPFWIFAMSLKFRWRNLKYLFQKERLYILYASMGGVHKTISF